jgi:probable rRNA maturation factor
MRSASTGSAESGPAVSAATRGAAGLRVEVQYAQRPPGVPGPVALRRWARGAYAAAGRGVGSKRATTPESRVPTLTVRVVGRAESQRLNQGFRGKDRPTNVLSFPASAEERALDGALGDLAICAPVVAGEAREQAKALTAHWAHMVVHGTLHLLGHDHERARQARAMEALEVEILRGFGFDDPYLRVTRGRV